MVLVARDHYVITCNYRFFTNLQIRDRQNKTAAYEYKWNEARLFFGWRYILQVARYSFMPFWILASSLFVHGEYSIQNGMLQEMHVKRFCIERNIQHTYLFLEFCSFVRSKWHSRFHLQRSNFIHCVNRFLIKKKSINICYAQIQVPWFVCKFIFVWLHCCFISQFWYN